VAQKDFLAHNANGIENDGTRKELRLLQSLIHQNILQAIGHLEIFSDQPIPIVTEYL